MKFLSIFTNTLLPLGLMATPIPEPVEIDETTIAPGAVAIPGLLMAGDVSARNETELSRRTDQICQIIGSSSHVNCRTCPSTDCAADYYVVKGDYYEFSCAANGQCVTVGGITNCIWDYTIPTGCYVSAIYTGSQCTVGTLGYC